MIFTFDKFKAKIVHPSKVLWSSSRRIQIRSQVFLCLMSPADLPSEAQVRHFLHRALRCLRPTWSSRPWSWVWGVACGGGGGAVIWCERFGRAGLTGALVLVWLVGALCTGLFVSHVGLQRKDRLMLVMLAPSSGGLFYVLYSTTFTRL